MYFLILDTRTEDAKCVHYLITKPFGDFTGYSRFIHDVRFKSQEKLLIAT